MPKIRDLGINTIPITMRPPEIGPGGAIFACHKSHGDQTSACGEPSCIGDEQSACGDVSCKPDDETSACGEPSCVGDVHSTCGDPSCAPKSPRSPHDHRASAFSPAAIAQLRQQLEIHIGQ